jgi:hypothetical protein
MNINWKKYITHIFQSLLSILFIILIAITFYALFIYCFGGIYFCEGPNDPTLPDAINLDRGEDDINEVRYNRDSSDCSCSCSSCTCSNPSINSIGHNGFTNLFNKYKNISRRKLYWYLCEKGKYNYSSYSNFKGSWNPQSKILDEVKNKLIPNHDKWLLRKRTLSWIFKRSGPGGGRGL